MPTLLARAALLALLPLAACGPVYETRYTYQPLPDTDGARACLALCENGRAQCRELATTRYGQCEAAASQERTLCELTAGVEHALCARDDQACLRKICGRRDCEYDDGDCVQAYNTCYTGCGGQVRAERVCTSGCP